MKKHIIILVSALAFSILGAGISAAQVKDSTAKAASTSSLESPVNTGDEICTLSNGAAIPCAYKEIAEQDIKQLSEDGGVRKPVVDGIKLCPTTNISTIEKLIINPTGYFDCKYFNTNGSPRLDLYTTFFTKQ